MVEQAVGDWQSTSMQLIPCGLVADLGGAFGRSVLTAVSFLGVRLASESRPGYLEVAEGALQRGETQKSFPSSLFFPSLCLYSDANTARVSCLSVFILSFF
jgi:hypothetical protein